jgi:hypothetical protein
MVKNLYSQMRHSHFIDIRKGKAELQLDFGRIFSDRMDLLAKIPDRF